MTSFGADLDADLARLDASTADLEAPAPVVAEPGPIRRYALLERLGEGGMGVVYTAYDSRLDRKVALKVLRREESEAARARFAREAQALARLSHPNVVTVYDTGEVGERPFLAMELVDGTNLRAWLASPRTLREVLAVFLAAGRGLAAAHAAGLIHRDIKPENILVSRDGTARVADFGLARVSGDPAPVTGEDSPALAQTPVQTRGGVGTPRYMAPEQRAGSADPRSDQYSYGLSLGEAVRDRRPPAWLDALVARSTAADPAERYPSMEALLDDLGRDRTRLRRALALGAATVAVAAAAALSMRLATGPEPCAGAARRLAGIWDDPVRAAVRASFVASGRADAADAYDRVAGRLDGYGGDLTAMTTEACEATAVRRTQSDALLDRRVACLDRRRDALRELTTLLRAPVAGPEVDRALDAATALPALADCADTTALMAEVPPSHDPRVVAVEARAASAGTLFALGRYPQAERVALGLLFEAPSVPHAPARARAFLAIGAVGRERQDVSGPMLALAEAGLRQGIVAASAGHLDDEVVAGWSGLLWTGAKRGKARESLQVELPARAALARCASPARPEVQLEHALGYAWIAIDSGAAAGRLERATELARRAYGPDSLEVAHLEVERATALHDAGVYPESIVLYSQAAERLTRAYGPRHPDVADALAFRGSSETDMGRLDDARRTFEQALAIYVGLDGPDSRRALRVTGDLGLVLVQDERFEEAIAPLERALAGEIRALGEEDKLTAIWRVNVATAQIPAGRLADARGQLVRALAVLEKTTSSNHLFRGVAETFLAWVALEEGHPEECEAHARASLAIYAATHDAHELYTAPPMDFIGRSLVARGRPAEALPLLEKNLAILVRAEGDEGLNAIGGHRQLGTALLAAGRVDDALPHLEQVVRVRAVKGHDLVERGVAELELARALWRKTQPDQARELARRALADLEAAGPRAARRIEEARAWLARPS